MPFFIYFLIASASRRHCVPGGCKPADGPWSMSYPNVFFFVLLPFISPDFFSINHILLYFFLAPENAIVRALTIRNVSSGPFVICPLLYHLPTFPRFSYFLSSLYYFLLWWRLDNFFFSMKTCVCVSVCLNECMNGRLFFFFLFFLNDSLK